MLTEELYSTKIITVVARGCGAIALPLNFNLLENSLSLRKFLYKKLGVDVLHCGGVWGKLIEILSSYNFFCQKFALACRKIATSCLFPHFVCSFLYSFQIAMLNA